MADIIKWQDVIRVISQQSPAYQKLCIKVLDFWQEKDPDVFKRIADTKKYHNGKIDIGIDIDPSIRPNKPGSPLKMDELTGSFFEFNSDPEFINLSSAQLKRSVMRDSTGMIRRVSIEDVAYHELSHAGHEEYLKAALQLGETSEDARVAIKSYAQNWLSKVDKSAAPLKTQLVDIIKKCDSVVNPLDLQSPIKEFGELVNSKYAKPGPLNEIEEKVDVYNTSVELYKNALGVTERLAVKLTDAAMQKVDPEFNRSDYDNFLELPPNQVPIAKQIPSYAANTLSDITPLKEYMARLRGMETSAKDLSSMTEKAKHGGAINTDKWENISHRLWGDYTILNKMTGDGKHSFDSKTPMLFAQTFNIDYKAAQELGAEAPKVINQVKSCEDKLADVARILSSGDKAKLAEAKSTFAKAVDQLLTVSETVIEHMDNVKAAATMGR